MDSVIKLSGLMKRKKKMRRTLETIRKMKR